MTAPRTAAAPAVPRWPARRPAPRSMGLASPGGSDRPDPDRRVRVTWRLAPGVASALLDATEWLRLLAGRTDWPTVARYDVLAEVLDYGLTNDYGDIRRTSIDGKPRTFHLPISLVTRLNTEATTRGTDVDSLVNRLLYRTLPDVMTNAVRLYLADSIDPDTDSTTDHHRKATEVTT